MVDCLLALVGAGSWSAAVHARPGEGVLGGALNVLLGEIQKHGRLLVTDATDRLRGDQDLPAGEPVAGLDNDLGDQPSLAVDREVLNPAHNAARRLNVITCDRARAAEMNIVPLVVPMVPVGVRRGPGNRSGEAAHSTKS